MNAINLEMMEEMASAWARLDRDAEARVAVLTANGRAFCTGLDMKDIAAGRMNHSILTTATPNRFSPASQSKPVIGAITGPAIGAGLDFVAMDCDIVVAAEHVTFGMPEVGVGMASLGSPFAAARVPRAVVMEMFLTGEPITAQRAQEIGLINYVTASDQVLPKAMALAQKVAEHAPNAVRQSRRNLLDACTAPPASRDSETAAARKPDIQQSATKGVEAFVNKRRAVW
ncbi:MAG: enoyl-CoA hydratase/isomerase family protein [Chloroflexi bacterium]|nr:enoyl-CoA hydratase/isomerase family protein [Chloroflexota bacterium]